MDGDLFKLLTGTGGLGAGALAATWFYLWRSRGDELKQRDVIIGQRDEKIDQLQAKIVSMLEAQLESEPQRRETLSGIGRSVQEQTALLKESLK